jgi:hypothetical protein
MRHLQLAVVNSHQPPGILRHEWPSGCEKMEKFFVKLSHEEFEDVESVQQSQVLASRRVNFEEWTGAWSGRRKEGGVSCGYSSFVPETGFRK